MDIDLDVTATGGFTDYYEFDITEAGNYKIKTSFYLQSCDTAVYLYDSSYVQLASNDDYVDLYGCIDSISLEPGAYYLRVEDFDGIHVYAHLEVTKL